jgi:hypothetical protein
VVEKTEEEERGARSVERGAQGVGRFLLECLFTFGTIEATIIQTKSKTFDA